MVDDGIPAELRDFIAKSIDSVAQLEALLLLRANPETSWDVVQLARRLYVNEAESDLHDVLATPERALNTIPVSELCPGSKGLEAVNARFR